VRPQSAPGSSSPSAVTASDSGTYDVPLTLPSARPERQRQADGLVASTTASAHMGELLQHLDGRRGTQPAVGDTRHDRL